MSFNGTGFFREQTFQSGLKRPRVLLGSLVIVSTIYSLFNASWAHPQQLSAAQTGSLTILIATDLDANAQLTDTEIAENRIAGVVVHLYDADDPDGAPCATATSGTDGQILFDSAARVNCQGGELRYEVDADTFPNRFIVGPVNMVDDDGNGATSTFRDDPRDTGPLVQMVDLSAGTDMAINIGIVAPRDYICAPERAYAVTTCFVNGDPLAAGSEAIGTDALVGFSYEAQGSAFPGTSMPYQPPDHLATTDQIGSVWGLSYNRQNNDIYASAFLKRHTGLGPLGLGGIYKLELTDNGEAGYTSEVISWLDVEQELGVDLGGSLVPSNVDRGLPLALDGLSRDSEAYQLIAKVGMGDIDLITDEGIDPPGFEDDIWIDRPYLLAVDLFNKDVLVIDTASKELVLTYAIPAPDPGCNLGEHRPWSVDYVEGTMYVGIICDGSRDATNLEALLPNSNLEAIIYEYDLTVDLAQATIPAVPTVEPSIVLRFPLDYERGMLRDSPPCIEGRNWHPWIDTITPSSNHYDICWPVPILSDIEFTATGNMLIGFTDRTSHQWGFFNFSPDPTDPQQFHTVSGGEILIACPDGSGGFILEDNGRCGQLVPNPEALNGEGPGGGEFFYADHWNVHRETVNGGLAVLPGSSEVMVAGMDPYNNDYFSAGGINWFNTEDGTPRDPGYMLYASANTDSPVVIDGTFGKSGGLGDVDLICPQIPLNIGDYVWFDGLEIEANGLQDPGELPLEGVLVTLTDMFGTVLTTTTNANGHYDFTVLRDQTYTITIDVTTATNYDGTILKPTDQAREGTSRLNDSDADLNGQIVVNTDRLGTSDHTFDAGFVIPIQEPTAIELLSFDVAWDGPAAARLTWETAVEIDNFGFKLYRGTTPEFEAATEIGFVSSAVTTGFGSRYAYQDSAIPIGNDRFWYWLVDVDTAGQESRHGPLELVQQSSNLRERFKLFLALLFTPERDD